MLAFTTESKRLAPKRKGMGVGMASCNRLLRTPEEQDGLPCLCRVRSQHRSCRSTDRLRQSMPQEVLAGLLAHSWLPELRGPRSGLHHLPGGVEGVHDGKLSTAQDPPPQHAVLCSQL